MGTKKQAQQKEKVQEKKSKRTYLVMALVEVNDEAKLLALGKKHSIPDLYQTEEEKREPYTVDTALLDVAFPAVIRRDGCVDVPFSRVDDCTEDPDLMQAWLEKFCDDFCVSRPPHSK